MAQQPTKARAVIPGKRVLGEVGAKQAQRKSQTGAVVPGRKILGDLAVKEAAKVRAVQRKEAEADPKSQKGPAPEPETRDESAVPNAERTPVQKPVKPVPKGMTERQALKLLKDDANAWPEIMRAELDREDGGRTGVLEALADAGKRARKVKMPADVKASLTTAIKESKVGEE